MAAVAVPLTTRPELTPDEQISLRHLEHYLPGYDKFFIAAEGMALPQTSGYDVQYFDARYFGGIQAHTRLLLSKGFYKRFLDYQYVLVYHLDALVFSDGLEYWCNRGYDFIGGPLQVEGSDRPNRVGNGGFSLRNVRSCLKVLRSRVPFLSRHELAGREAPGRWIKQLGFFNDVSHEIRISLATLLYDDIFLCTRGAHYYPDFKVAPLEVALEFAFDEAPATCFRLRNDCLPFGCHGWFKHDRTVWEPYLLSPEKPVAGPAPLPAA